MADSASVMQFLHRVWGERESWVDLPSKVNGHWIPWNARWPEDADLIERRVDSCLEDSEDLYFSVAQFRSRGRRIKDVLPTHWLWADLDKVDPVFLGEDHVHPTIAWESSPGRFQCLWHLDQELKPELIEKLNRKLSYTIGADKGGWDLTQVLRPPGSENHKYDPVAEVELLWDSTKTYQPKSLLRTIGQIEPVHDLGEQVATGGGAQPTQERRQKRDAIKLPARARRLLRATPNQVVPGERSTQLWQLECLLAEAGYNAQEIYDLVWDSAWNKHKEVHSGARQLTREIEKALRHVGSKTAQEKARRATSANGKTPHVAEEEETEDVVERRKRRASPFVSYANFLSSAIQTPRWLVEEIWSSASHGIIGGEPKTSKSSLTLALALSVATGKPFLGKYKIPQPGPVIVVQEENAPWVTQDRLRKIAKYYGLLGEDDVEIRDAPRGSIAEHSVRLSFPIEAPLYLLNNYGFDLTDDDDREMLEEEIRERGAKLVILDPLYLMVGTTNMNQAHELAPLFQWLMALRYNYDCAVVLVHHWHKAPVGGHAQSARRAGQRLMGSGLLHGWVESALYCEALDPEGDRLCVRVEREFRNVAPRSALQVKWRFGEPGDIDGMDVEILQYNIEGQVLSIVSQQPGITLTLLAEELGVDKRTARKRAVGAGCNLVGGKKGRGNTWQVYPPGKED